MRTLSEHCECTRIRVFKWNLNFQNPISFIGHTIVLVNTKSISVSKIDPHLQDVTYTRISETDVFPSRFLTNPSMIKVFAYGTLKNVRQISQSDVGYLRAKLKDYLVNNYVIDIEALSNNNTIPVIVVEIYKEEFVDECDDVEGVIKGDIDRVYRVDDIINSLKHDWSLPLSYNMELIEVPALERFEGLVLNDSDKFEEEEEEVDVCAICLEEKKDKMIKASCSHAFHGGCLARWLWRKLSCPICRLPLP